jgi:tetratricopeptide (TPR) repeat protein
MADGTIVPNPPRIVEEDGVAGALLRRAEDGYRASLLEPSAFRQLERRRERRALWSQGLAAIAAAAAVVLIITAGVATGPSRSAPAQVEREVIRSAPALGASEVASVEAPSQPVVAVPPAPKAVAPIAKPSHPPASEPSCDQLARERKSERALSCYRAFIAGASVDTELQLYRAARLFADELGEPARALMLLDDYRARFPGGALRAEADWLRIQCLARTKNVERALGESEALLGTPAGAALSAEIHLLRGRLYEDSRSDCAQANSEYVALLGEPTRLGDEAEFRRADCLLELGRKEEARSAFERYLDRARPERADAARERLRELAHENAIGEQKP